MTKFTDLGAVDQYLQGLINDPWIRKRWKIVCDPDFHPQLIQGGQEGVAGARKANCSIRLPFWAMNNIIVLHEFIHLITPIEFGPGHGRFFARSLLELVGHLLGSEVREILRNEYIRFGVQYQPFKVYTPETLRTMKERGHKLAKKRISLKS